MQEITVLPISLAPPPEESAFLRDDLQAKWLTGLIGARSILACFWKDDWSKERMKKGQTHRHTYRKAGIQWPMFTLIEHTYYATTPNVMLFILYSMRERLASPGRSLHLLAQAETEGSSVSQRWAIKTGVYNLNPQICWSLCLSLVVGV